MSKTAQYQKGHLKGFCWRIGQQEHIKERQIILELFCDHWPVLSTTKEKKITDQRVNNGLIWVQSCHQTVLLHMKTVICNYKILCWKDCIQLEHINDSLVHFLFSLWLKMWSVATTYTKNARTIYFGLCIIWLCTISVCSVIWQSKIA